MEDTKESHSSRKSPEGCSREPLLQLQSLQAQEKQVVSLPKVHDFKELSWPPRVAAGGYSSSLKQSPQHPLPHSHSQDPVIITAGRPIVILPNDYIHGHRNFTPGANLSAAFNLQPPIQSLGDFCDHTPAPIITPIDDDYAGPIPVPAIAHIDDDSPSAEYMVAPKCYGGVKAIEFTDDKQCIVSAQPGVNPNSKEESTLSIIKQASLDVSCVDANKPEAELNVIPKSPPITDFGVTSLPTMPDDESANIEMPSQILNPPLLGVESGSKASSPLGLNKLQLLAQKSSSMRVSPLIMSCYEESKEQLVLDDSDSELEMPECSKSGSCTPQQSIEQDTSESMTGTDVQAHNSCTKLPPIREESVDDVDEKSDSYEPPPKRAKMVETSSTDSNSPTADECSHTTVGSDASQNSNTHSPVADEASSTAIAESSESFCQTVPNESLLFADCAPLEAAESTKTSSVLATTIPDCPFELECPHEPVDLASEGKDTIDQMLPMESAREHAMVPNLVRCADSNQLNDDRDRPNDDSNDSIYLNAYVPAVDLHSSHIEGVQARVGDNSLVRGQTVVEEKMETEIQVPEPHDDKPSQHYSAKPQTNVHSHSMVVPSTIESAQLPTEHQIVPDEFGNSTTPSSSQSLYTDHDFHEKCKPSFQLLDESNVDDELDSPQVLAVSLNSIEKRWSVAATLPRSDDQALPDVESPSKLPTQHYGSPVGIGSSYGLDSDEQKDSGAQNFAPFGFRVGKHTSYSQSSENSISTTRLNLGRPHLRLGLSKRQQCAPLHIPK